MARVFIAGSNGLLGQKLALCFQKNFEVHAGDLQPTSYVPSSALQYHAFDLTQRRETTRLVSAIKPDVVVNAAAFTEVDGAEDQKELCWKVNVTGIENLVVAARKNQSRLVHVSTDYIFDGSHGPYREDASPNPTGYYAKSKLAGENAIINSPLVWTIVRTMVLFGTGINVRPNFVTWLIQALRAGKTVRIVDDQWGNVTLADDLAQGIYQAVVQQKSGIYNMAGADFLSRYEFSLLIAEIFELNPQLIQRIKTSELKQKAPRPLISGLILDKTQTELGLSFLTARESLLNLKSQLTGNI